jgi:hypothetical protein
MSVQFYTDNSRETQKTTCQKRPLRRKGILTRIVSQTKRYQVSKET